MNLAGVRTKKIHGVLHVECRDCGDLQPHYDIVSNAGGHFCRRCADANAPKPSDARMDAPTLRAILTGTPVKKDRVIR